jgi:hypothetical protein
MMYSGVSDDSSLSGCDSVFSGVYTTDGNSLSTPGRNGNTRDVDFRARLAAEDERIAHEFDLHTVIPRPYSTNQNSAMAMTGDADCINSSKVGKNAKIDKASRPSTRSSKAEPGRAMTTLTDVQDHEDVASESARVSQTIPLRREDSHRDKDDAVPEPASCLSLDVDIETDHEASEQEDNYEGEVDFDDDDGVLSVIMPPECDVAFPDILGKKKQGREPDLKKAYKKGHVDGRSGIYYPASYPVVVARQLPPATPPPPPPSENPESMSALAGNCLSMLPLSAKSIFAGAYDSLVQSIRTKNLSQDAVVGEVATAAEANTTGAAMQLDAQSIMTWDHQSGLDIDRGDARGTLPPLSSGSNSGGSVVCNRVSAKRKLWGCRVDRLIVISTAVLLIALGLAVGAKVASDRVEANSPNDNLDETGSSPQPVVPTPSTSPPMAEFPTTEPPPLSKDPADYPTKSKNPHSPAAPEDPGDSDTDDEDQPTPKAKATSAPGIPAVDVPNPVQAPVMTPTTGLISATFAPRTARPTRAPAPSPTAAAPTQLTPPADETSAVGDCEDSLDFVVVNFIPRTCEWLATTSSGFKSFWCGSQQEVLEACPKTCGACNAAPIQPQVASPTSSPSAFAVPEEPVLFTESPANPDNSTITEPPANPDDDSIIVNQADVRQAVINVAPPSTSLALVDSSSPQSEALSWLEESFLQEQESGGIPSWRLQQRFALATFATTASNEHERGLKKSTLGWMENENECMWPGISCDGSGKIIAITIAKEDSDGSSEAIGGSLPPEWAMLADSLQLIDLAGIGLTGAIPSEFGQLYKLQTLRLAENNMSGSIPSELSGMVSLMELSLHSNQFTGDFPSEAISQLGSLDFLTLHRTGITGDLSPICERNRQFISLIITCSALGGDCFTFCYAPGTE